MSADSDRLSKNEAMGLPTQSPNDDAGRGGRNNDSRRSLASAAFVMSCHRGFARLASARLNSTVLAFAVLALVVLALAGLATMASVALCQAGSPPPLSPGERANRLVAAMTLDEKIRLVHASFGVPIETHLQPKGALGSAGFNPGIPRLGIPPLQETDAGLGVANPKNADYDATAMPAALALGATFDPQLAREAGATIGAEARAMGFSVLLGGGANLVREPRGGRNFEYVSEDPLLTGEIAGAEVAGVQSQRIISTLKHFALNSQENGRVVLNAKLAEAPFRESDLLAFEIAMERGSPGAIMSAYNRVNGPYVSDSAHLMTDVLKQDWGFAGWIMTDWGGTHSTEIAALSGLDQESGEENDLDVYYGAPLKMAVEAGRVPMSRLDDMVIRILRTQIAAGLFDDPPHPGGQIDFRAHAIVARTIATRGIVLLKNDNKTLPLGPHIKRLLVVGGHADIGVLSGGGSSQVVPLHSIRFDGIPAKMFYGKPRLIDPSPPLDALRAALSGTDVTFLDGQDPAKAARQAHEADAVVVFADRWSNESLDLTGLGLPFNQDELIAAVAAANPKTIVVLETPGGVTMPWLSAVPAVLEAWYPGERGGEAIADILTGRVSPSGRLPVTFSGSENELPRLRIPDHSQVASYPKEPVAFTSFDVDYNVEGADVGYKWYLRTHRTPLFPFGYGLSYSTFAVSNVSATARDGTVSVAFDITNVGTRAGIDTPQVYLDGRSFTRRLVGWGQAALAPGESRHITLSVDPRLTANFDVAAHGWRVDAGRYTVAVRPNALADGPAVEVLLRERVLPARHGPCGADGKAGTLCVGSR